MSFRDTVQRHRGRALPAVLLVLGGLLGWIYRGDVIEWFDVFDDPKSNTEATRASAAAPAVGPMPSEHVHPLNAAVAPYSFSDSGLGRMKEVFATYEAMRALLANDSTNGIAAYGEAATSALRAVADGETKAPADVKEALDDASASAETLGKVPDVAAAREAFGRLSRALVALARSDPRLKEGLHLFQCPMAEGYQHWFQPGKHLQNPYMGRSMLECGVSKPWSEAQEREVSANPDATLGESASGDVAYYTCPMHPSVKQQGPGQCPICGMDLTPVTKKEQASGALFIDEAKRQRIGVRTEAVTERPMTLSVRSVGAVKVDETGLADVNLRMGGWVQKLLVNKTGQRVRRGQTLFTLYSPELYTAQLEFLAAVRRQPEATTDTFVQMAKAARQRLRLLGMSDTQIDEVKSRGEANEHVPILSPASGTVIEKRIVEGARVDAGMLVYRIADLSRVWIDAEVYESDLPHIDLGQPVTVELPYVPNQSFQGKVDFVYPTLEGRTRTGRVRVVLQNTDLELKPDMYANVLFEVDLGSRLAVPEAAVIYTGPRRLVFVDLGDDKLEPKQVQLGVHANGYYEVTSGLSKGDVVVTSGNFLIAAESRIRSATEHWEEPSGAE